MKKIKFLFLFVIFINSNLLSQEDFNRNKKYFNISKFSLHHVRNISESIFIPSIGNFTNHYEKLNSFSYSIYSINGWFLFPWLSTGIGVGYEYQNTMKFNLMPIYLDLRTYLANDRNSFYFYVNGGIIYGLNKNIQKGILLDTGIGYKFFIKKNLCMIIGFGFNARTLLNISGFPEPDPIHDFSLGSNSINIGILF